MDTPLRKLEMKISNRIAVPRMLLNKTFFLAHRRCEIRTQKTLI